MKKLGDICDIQAGGTPLRSKKEFWDSGSIPWVKISDINSKFINKTEEFITKAGLENSSAKIFHKGTILYTIFATVGEVAILNCDAATNQAIAGIRITDGCVMQNYLYYSLIAIKDKVKTFSRGVAQNNINLSMLRSLEINIPTIEEQKLKTDCLDKITLLIEKKKQQLKNLDLLAKSRFIEMFGDVKNQKYVFLSRYAEFSSGYSFKTECFQKDGVPIIRISNINGDKVTVDNVVYYSNSFWDKNPSFRVNKYDILIAMSGATTGKTGMFLSDTHALLNQRVAIIKPTLNCSTKEFLLVFTKMESFLEQIKLYSAGCAQPNISIKQLKNIKIPYASIEQQHNFSLFIQQLDKSKFRMKKCLKLFSYIRHLRIIGI